MGKSLSSDSVRARSLKRQKEASRRAAPDARERIPTGAGGAARSYHFYGAAIRASDVVHYRAPWEAAYSMRRAAA